MPFEVSKQIVDPNTITLFEFLPQTSFVLWACYFLLIFNTVALAFGFLTRLQLFSIFILYNSFVIRNVLIVDGEDTVFRLMAFYLFFSPSGYYLSVDNWIRKNINWGKNQTTSIEKTASPQEFAIWPLRLIQIQTASIVLFSACEKLNGVDWLDGTALYYVSRLDDLFYRFPLPSFLFESMIFIKLMTWATLVFELAAPIAVWFQRTRIPALIVLFSFHLSLEYTMNLNLFQYLMILGWCSFLRPGDFAFIKRRLDLIKQRLPPKSISVFTPLQVDNLKE
ncbi:HTTM domain-containing protein [Mariniblastus sp.]|nr:HTTM domain-containing protein [Mariniblastus sp.]